uniref:Uncharacterized protein n=1 Tax=Anguilla anguilla TaxID=7936 RepID=A0A0E9W4C0_ANGAN
MIQDGHTALDVPTQSQKGPLAMWKKK